jgi:hypothetical protein
VFVVREGEVAGETLMVLAFSPIFEQDGVVRLATWVDAIVPGATRFDGPAWLYAEEAAARREAGVDAASVVETASAEATSTASGWVRLRVSKPGIQEVTRAQLQAANAAWSGANLANAAVTFRGKLIPIQVVGTTAIRFYVASVGDRWNSTDSYFVAIENDATKRSPAMSDRGVVAAAAGAPSVVLDRGVWMDPCKYSSIVPGPDGDHWFAREMRENGAEGPKSCEKYDSTALKSFTAALWYTSTVSPQNNLPLAAGTSTFTMTFSPYKVDSGTSQPAYAMKAKPLPSGNEVSLTVNVLDPSDANGVRWLENASHVFTTPDSNPSSMLISMNQSSPPAGLLFESLSFERPVQLSFQGGRGGQFSGKPGQTVYNWANLPAGASLYDVTTPVSPTVITGASTSGFVDGQAARAYLLAGTGFLHQPLVEAYTPFVFNSIVPANVVYIVPNNDYVAPLAPLVNLRKQQGYKVTIVDVRRLYDGYSFGQVSPQAIRKFLQQAYATWKSPNPRVSTAVMVGDGSFDGRNYRGSPDNLTLIPPYVRDGIDPWLNETACDNCYGQLTDEDPHTGDGTANNPTFFSMELRIGRLPVKDVFELTALANKIVKYETTSTVGSVARSQVLFIADNYRVPYQPGLATDPRWQCDDSKLVCSDRAGDFAAISDGVRALYATAPDFLKPRLYFDPMPQYQTPSGQTWRVASPDVMGNAVQAALNAGPGIVVYNGHANVYYAGNIETKVPNGRSAVLDYFDPDALYDSKSYIQLSMTCQTSKFANQSNAGTTLDEKFLLDADGGPAAVWGPAGLSVVHGHEWLQKGFFDALSASRGSVRIGDLVDAGYLALMIGGAGDTDDVLRTFTLLGDPLTRVRLDIRSGAYLPFIDR